MMVAVRLPFVLQLHQVREQAERCEWPQLFGGIAVGDREHVLDGSALFSECGECFEDLAFPSKSVSDVVAKEDLGLLDWGAMSGKTDLGIEPGESGQLFEIRGEIAVLWIDEDRALAGDHVTDDEHLKARFVQAEVTGGVARRMEHAPMLGRRAIEDQLFAVGE